MPPAVRGADTGSNFCDDPRAGAETGIGKPLFAQMIERSRIGSNPVRLQERRGIGHQPQPAQIIHNTLMIFSAHPTAINIINPQQKPPAEFARAIMRNQRGPGMAQMQRPGG